MTTPQQPELARSQRSAVTPVPPDATSTKARATSEGAGPVPEDNLPGHHPPVEQDKPTGPPPKPKTARRKTETRAEARPAATDDDQSSSEGEQIGVRRFAFEFEPLLTPAAAMVGVTRWTSWVDVGAGRLRVRFGPWSLDASLDDVTGVERTGPYRFAKVAGPPHLSFADRGLTFATNRRAGLCIRFSRPVRGLDPLGMIRHPAVTVTTQDLDELEALLR